MDDPTENVSAEQVKKLADELSLLSKQQSQALLSSAYMKMPKEEAEEYDRRRLRIGVIAGLIGAFKPNR